MRPVRNVFQELSRTEQRRAGVVAYLWLYCTVYNCASQESKNNMKLVKAIYFCCTSRKQKQIE
jgi:hypothetical protein